MIEFFRGWILNIITLVIFLVLLEIILPSGKMKKYVQMVSGFILIIAIINPFVGVLKKGVDVKDFIPGSSNFLDRKEIEASSKLLKEKQTRQIVETYRKKIIRQAQEGLREIGGNSEASVDVIINEDVQSENFGEIKRLYVTLKPQVKGNAIQPVAKVEKVEIGKEAPAETKSGTNNGKVDADTRKRIEDKLNRLLDVQKDNIVINQLQTQGG